VEAAKAPNILEALARGRYLVSRNELGDHAEWTKLVFVLNIESMHQSPIGSESHSIRFRARQGVRKATLASILRKSRPSLRLNEHLERPCRVPARLQDGAGGDCFEAAWIAFPIWAFSILVEVQES
jgi:hypothetical protein